MENVEQTNGCVSFESKLKSMRKKRFSSSVSGRLDPDFNPRHLANIPNETRIQKEHCFEYFLLLISSNVVFDYLQKILHFLRSDQEELSLPFTDENEREFLVRIAKDNECLMSFMLNNASSAVGKQIQEVVNKNANSFKWTYEFEDGSVSQNVLVYKKKLLKSTKNEIDAPQSPAAASVASTEYNSLTNRDVSSSFRIQMLNTTLKFIKDVDRLILNYPEMTLKQAQFVHSLICQSNQWDDNIGFGFKSIYSPLFDAMKNFNEVYEFKASFIETNNPFSARILLEKIPILKDPTKSNTNESEELNSSNMSEDSTVLKQLSKTKNKYRAKQKLVNTLHDSFLKKSMERILSFINDETEASLEFAQVSPNEALFLQGVIGMSGTDEYYPLFNENCVILLKRIFRNYKRENWMIHVSVGKKCNGSDLCKVTFIKVPYKSKKAPNQSITDTKLEMKTAEATKSCNEITPGKCETQRKSQNKNQSRQIMFQSAGAQAINDENSEEKKLNGTINVGVETKGKTMTRKEKLLIALSTPLESDVAEKMMRRMGWDGGALGVRGDGITEPIMPAIHISPGAGLGHVIKTNNTTEEFGIYLLTKLLCFLQSESSDVTINFPRTISKKECRFFQVALHTLNDKNRIVLNGQQEAELVDSIAEIMKNTPSMTINFIFQSDRRSLRLKKCDVLTANSRKNVNIIPQVSIQKPELNNNITEQHVNEIYRTYNLKDICTTEKAGTAMAYRIIFIKRIKDFVESDLKCLMSETSFVMNTKIRSFITCVITSLNERLLKIPYSQIENNNYGEILSNDIQYCLIVVFGWKHFTLHKMQRTELFNQPPILKSKDIENTIVYQNGVIQTNDSIDLNESQNAAGIDEASVKYDDVSLYKSETTDTDIVISERDNKSSSNDDNKTDCVCQINFEDESLLITDLETSEGYQSALLSSNISILEENNDSNTINQSNSDCVEVNNNDMKNKVEVLTSNEDSNDNFSTSLNKSDNPDNTNSSFLIESTSNISLFDLSKLELPKYIAIYNKNIKRIDLKTLKEVQTLISDSFDKCTFLPLLKCHGVKNGGLIYSCHCKKSLSWVKDVVSVASVEIIDTDFQENLRKMEMKINSFIKVDKKVLFERLEIYYPSLNTMVWDVINEQVYENCVVFTINLEEDGYKFICKHNFTLFAGIDKVEFSLVWE